MKNVYFTRKDLSKIFNKSTSYIGVKLEPHLCYGPYSCYAEYLYKWDTIKNNIPKGWNIDNNALKDLYHKKYIR